MKEEYQMRLEEQVWRMKGLEEKVCLRVCS